MKYYKYNKVRKGSSTFDVVLTGSNEDYKLYTTNDDKNCLVEVKDESVFYLGLKGQPQELQIVEIPKEEFDTLKLNTREWSGEWEQVKIKRAEDIADSKVEVNKIKLDADEISMDRIDRILTVASCQYIQAIANGKPSTEAYKQIFKDTKIPWKTTENKFHEFSVEELITAQNEALKNMQAKWAQYV